MKSPIDAIIYMRKIRQENCIIKRMCKKNEALTYTIISIIIFNVLFNLFIYALIGATFKWFTFITCSVLSIGFLSLVLYMFFEMIIGERDG